MSQKQGNCRGCEKSVDISPAEIEAQMQKVRQSGVPLADAGRYAARLQLCAVCDQLLYGHTCLVCGCLVQVRALNALRICPHPGENKW